MSQNLERVPRGLRICVEFRNPTWLQDSTFRLLEEHGAPPYRRFGAMGLGGIGDESAKRAVRNIM
jgi:hypothetical protein